LYISPLAHPEARKWKKDHVSIPGRPEEVPRKSDKKVIRITRRELNVRSIAANNRF